MIGFFRFVFKIFITLSIAFSSVFSPAVIIPPSENLDFDVLEYPKEAVKTLDEWGITEEELKSRADADKELYIGAQGHRDVNGVVISPYYTAKIGDKDIPVYAATVFIGETQCGELHSFSEVYLDEGEEFSFNIELYSEDFSITILNEMYNNGIGYLDCHSKNFVVDRTSGHVEIIDFEWNNMTFDSIIQSSNYKIFNNLNNLINNCNRVSGVNDILDQAKIKSFSEAYEYVLESENKLIKSKRYCK